MTSEANVNLHAVRPGTCICHRFLVTIGCKKAQESSSLDLRIVLIQNSTQIGREKSARRIMEVYVPDSS